jgi:hypothetical protein
MVAKSGVVMNMPKGATSLADAIIANALRVYNGGSMFLRVAGGHIGNQYSIEMKRLYGQEGSGKPYQKKKYGKEPVKASLPGQPPARQLGDLQNSVKFAVSRMPGRAAGSGRFVKGFGKTVVSIYTKSPHAVALEKGTSQIAARPAWIVANQNMKMRAMIANNVKAWFVRGERKAARTKVVGVPTVMFPREKSRAGAPGG